MDMSMSMTSSATSASSTSSGMSSMSSSSSSSMSMDMMAPYLHFTSGDNLLFKTWAPSSHGAIAGACIGLAFLAIFERWISAMRAVLTGHWRERTLIVMRRGCHEADSSPSTPSQEKASPDVEEVNVNSLSSKYAGPAISFRRSPRAVAPFILAHDLPRGILYAFQALLAYALMLSVMTFQAAFVISIILGLGIGEVLFGRLGSGDGHLLH